MYKRQILSRGPAAFQMLVGWWNMGSSNPAYYFYVPLIVIVFIAMVTFIVWMTNAERRIPVSYAKRVVGRKMYGGQNTHIPIKVNMSGVMPVSYTHLPRAMGQQGGIVKAEAPLYLSLIHIYFYPYG